MSKLKGASGWLASGLLAFLAPFLCCIGPILALVFGASAAASASTFTNRYRWLFFGLAAVSFGYAGWKLIYKKRQKTGLSNLQSLLTAPGAGIKKLKPCPPLPVNFSTNVKTATHY
jgi:hypothetical protein